MRSMTDEGLESAASSTSPSPYPLRGLLSPARGEGERCNNLLKNHTRPWTHPPPSYRS
jgi:hypothetical protein